MLRSTHNTWGGKKVLRLLKKIALGLYICFRFSATYAAIVSHQKRLKLVLQLREEARDDFPTGRWLKI